MENTKLYNQHLEVVNNNSKFHTEISINFAKEFEIFKRIYYSDYIDGKYQEKVSRMALPITLHELIEIFLNKKQMKNTTFPKDDFAIIVENNNGKEIIDFLVRKGFNNNDDLIGGAVNGICYSVVNNKIKCDSRVVKQIFTLKQLKALETKINKSN